MSQHTITITECWSPFVSHETLYLGKCSCGWVGDRFFSLKNASYDTNKHLQETANTRPTWQQYFLGVAQAVSERADCTRRKVGCVIVDADHRIVGTGYNGSPAGGPSCLDGQCPRGQLSLEEQPAGGSYANCVAVHAEANALLYARTSLKGCTAYVTCEPCSDCAKLLAGAGIQTIITT